VIVRGGVGVSHGLKTSSCRISRIRVADMPHVVGQRLLQRWHDQMRRGSGGSRTPASRRGHRSAGVLAAAGRPAQPRLVRRSGGAVTACISLIRERRPDMVVSRTVLERGGGFDKRGRLLRRCGGVGCGVFPSSRRPVRLLSPTEHLIRNVHPGGESSRYFRVVGRK
jgi:hypothetical protein